MPTLSGTVKDGGGAFVARLVRAYRRDNGAYVGSAISNASTGAWSITTADTSEHFAVQSTGNVDPMWDSVALAMPLDKSLICLKGRVATAFGDASVSGGYLNLDGTGDYLLLDGSGTLAPGTGKFTVEMRYTPTSIATDVTLYDSRPAATNGYYIALFAMTSGGLLFYANSGDRISTATGLLANGVESHVALSRDASGNWKMWHNGTQVGSTYTDTNNYLNAAARPAIGASGASLGANSKPNGKLRDIFVTADCRYTTAFTPPAAGTLVHLYGGTENAIIYDRLVPV